MFIWVLLGAPGSAVLCPERERESENEESERDGKQRNEEELYLAHCRFRERRDV